MDDAMGDRLLALDMEAVLLRAELASASGGGETRRGRAPAPRDGGAPHAWKLAENPDQARDTLDKYDVRPDDAAIIAAREGAAFLARLGETPSRSLLREAAHALPAFAIAGVPDISIVIPVHGQLAWTLNCLDSVFAHASRRAFEVIVVDDASPDGSGEILAELARPGLRVVRLSRNSGFIAACNAGAAVASGDLIVLLNNDTRVAEGWLDALADSFALFPRAGLVGSKLLYPDGTLQEAGAIIWRDGSAWNYGRGADPNHPAFCCARRSDYVSGASVAIPAALWRVLGGLDPLFAPAYGEDADLAMRVRAAGREVWFQPASRVVHYEGRTSGTDTEGGVKSHQVANLKKLFVRWHGALARHGRPGEEAYFERDREMVRRALVVESTTPTPDQDAGSGVAVHSIRILQRLGYKVHFVPQDNFLFQPGPTGDLQRRGVECGYAPFDIGFTEYVARHGELFDVILVFRPDVLARVEAALRLHAPQAALVFSNADLHFLRRQREAALRGDSAAAAEADDARSDELALIGRADVTMTLSTFERDLLAREAPDAAVLLQPFPYDVVGTSAAFAARRDFCFLGSYGHPPNVDAAVYFVRDVLPLIRAVLPDARVVLAGSNPTEAIRALAGPGVEVAGFVESVGDLFDAARVFVCPLRFGAGVKGKVVAAMAHGLPVVSTSCGAEGMEVTAGRDLLVAHDPADFAERCVRLHEDAALWRGVSEAGLAYVARACSTEAGEAAFAAAIDMAWERKLGLRERGDAVAGDAPFLPMLD